MQSDTSKYLQAFEVVVENSDENQSMKEFIHTILTDVLVSIGAGAPILNVMGVGSGPGVKELEFLKVLHENHPNAKIENEVVEPSKDMLNKYKALISKAPGLDYITFRWNQMTATEFENKWKKTNPDKKMHFINMIEMLYYVEDPIATIKFYRSLLHKDGKILITLLAAESGWIKMEKTFPETCKEGPLQSFSAGEVKNFLDAQKIPYKNYKLPSQLDITDCFTPGAEKGELMLDLLTETINFRKTAPPELEKRLMEFLRHPDNSQEANGRILFECSMEALLIDA